MKRRRALKRAKRSLFCRRILNWSAAVCAVWLIAMGSPAFTAEAADESGAGVFLTEQNETERAGSVSDDTGDEIYVSGDDSNSITQNAEENGIHVSKTLRKNDDGTLQIELESYATGSVETHVVPADIILLLDTSGSMQHRFDSVNKNIDGLKKAARQFVMTLNDQNEDLAPEDQTRLALVQYSSSAKTEILRGLENVSGENTDLFIGDLYSKLKPGGKTNMDLAMQDALDIVEERGASDRVTSVILFTDGMPAPDAAALDGFVMKTADDTLEKAQKLKKAGVYIYSLSIDAGADNTGDSVPVYENKGLDHYLSNGTEETGGIYNAPYSNVTALENRFLHLVCSNNVYALSMDKPNEEDLSDPGQVRGEGGVNYFFTAKNTTELIDAFQVIAESTTKSDSMLGVEAEVRDYVTGDYEITDPSDIRVRIAAYAGNGQWGEETDPGDAASVAADSRSVRVSGFDYGANYVPDASAGEARGAKLMVSFAVAPVPGFGGNRIATNTADSGVYDGGGEGAEPVVRYPVPSADLKIRGGIRADNQVIYAGDTVEWEDLVSAAEGLEPDGRNNSHVNIRYSVVDAGGSEVAAWQIPAGSSRVEEISPAGLNADKAEEAAAGDETDAWAGQKWQPAECGQYQVVCRVTPVESGHFSPLELGEDAEVHVLYPEARFRDSAQSAGEELDFETGDSIGEEKLGGHLVRQSWNCAHGEAMPENRPVPQLGYRITPVNGVAEENGRMVIEGTGNSAGGSGGQVEPVEVVVGVYRVSDDTLSMDLSDKTVFLHECERGDACGYDEDEAGCRGVRFLIHVLEEEKEPEEAEPEPEEPETEEPEAKPGEPEDEKVVEQPLDAEPEELVMQESVPEDHPVEAAATAVTTAAAAASAPDPATAGAPDSGENLSRNVATGDRMSMEIWLAIAAAAFAGTVGFLICYGIRKGS